jgi:hypothetical protein
VPLLPKHQSFLATSPCRQLQVLPLLLLEVRPPSPLLVLQLVAAAAEAAGAVEAGDEVEVH